MTTLFIRLCDSARSIFNSAQVARKAPFGRVSKAEIEQLDQALRAHQALFYRA